MELDARHTEGLAARIVADIRNGMALAGRQDSFIRESITNAFGCPLTSDAAKAQYPQKEAIRKQVYAMLTSKRAA